MIPHVRYRSVTYLLLFAMFGAGQLTQPLNSALNMHNGQPPRCHAWMYQEMQSGSMQE